MSRSLATVSCFLISMGICLTFPIQSVSADPPRITQVEVGFQGLYKVGYWTPVTISLQAGSESFTGHVEVIVPDGDGVPTKVTSAPDQPVQVFPAQPTEVSLLVKFGRTDGDMIVRFVSDQQARAERRFQVSEESGDRYFPRALPSTDRLILSVGPSLDLREAMPRKRQALDPASHVAELADAQILPNHWYGYEGVDALVLSTSNPGLLEPLRNQGRAEALKKWIELGGVLLITAGEKSAPVLSSGGVLAELLPGKFDQLRTLRRVSAVESYSETQIPIEIAQRDFQIEVPRLTDTTGNIEAFAGSDSSELPLVIRSVRGFGQIVFLAFDLGRPPLSNWESRPLLIRKLLDIEQYVSTANQQESLAKVNTLGYVDLVGQVRAALDEFEGVTVVPFWIVGGLVSVYLLVIGPLDYWLVHKLLKRPAATWFTFPLWVVLIGGGAYVAADRLKGRELVTNQIDLVDVDMDSGLVRGTAWNSIFSPRSDTYDLSFEPQPPGKLSDGSDPQVLLSWMGLPGEGLGGMSSASVDSPLLDQPYELSPDRSEILGLPIQTWSTKHLTTRWNCQAVVPLEADLTEKIDHMLSGTLTNGLGFDLEEAHLFYDRWVYPISRLRQGEQLSVDQSLQPLTTKTFLTRQRIIGGKDVSSKYAEATTHVPRILQMMMFHRAAGGAQYTAGLPNRYQGFCDLSQHLKLGRALLVFSKPTAGSSLKRDGTTISGQRDQRWTFYRLVIAVDRGKKPTRTAAIGGIKEESKR